MAATTECLRWQRVFFGLPGSPLGEFPHQIFVPPAIPRVEGKISAGAAPPRHRRRPAHGRGRDSQPMGDQA